jgi:hypothetical protein
MLLSLCTLRARTEQSLPFSVGIDQDSAARPDYTHLLSKTQTQNKHIEYIFYLY